MKDKSEDVGHFSVSAGAVKHLVLQLPEGQRQSQKGCTVAKASNHLTFPRAKKSPILAFWSTSQSHRN
jgi:hypothetical protein